MPSYISPAADLYLTLERPQGVACVTGMPEEPVYYWTREGGWNTDPHGRQSANIRYPHDAALDYAYEGENAPGAGDEIAVIDGGRDSLTITIYRAGIDADGDPDWREISVETIDLRAWVIERVRDACGDALIEATRDLDIIDPS